MRDLFSASLGEEEFWIGFGTQGLVPEWRWLFLAGTAATLLLAGIGAWLVQRRINRPLKALAEAARALGQGQQAPMLAHDAPSEIAQVAANFDAMATSLAQADAERALMLAGVSHDLRTPLSKLRLCVEMLRPQADSELVESMTRSIATADESVGQFVAFARIGDGETPQWCDPTDLIRSVVDDLGTPGAVGLELEELAPQELRPLALRRALTNLLINAQRYAPGEITIRARQREGTLELAVLDRGPGIPEQDMTRALQPFSRLETARGNIPGAGLGLAIVDRIARQHGGKLRLENRPSGGLEASITLPWRR